MKVGFTGTRSGMTLEQAEEVRTRLLTLIRAGMTEFHHGDAIGADAQAHGIMSGLLLVLGGGIKIVVHPSTRRDQRAFTHGDEIRGSRNPLLRNKDIVNETDTLIVCPVGYEEEARSGTWATYRFGRYRNKEIITIWPDGSVRHEPAVRIVAFRIPETSGEI